MRYRVEQDEPTLGMLRPRRRRLLLCSVWVGVLALSSAGVRGDGDTDEPPEARVTLDAKDADVHGVTEALAEVAGFQVVFDPDLACRLTVGVHEARWADVLRASLNACALGYEANGNVLRIAKRTTLTREASDQRKLAEVRANGHGNDQLNLFRLSYARAKDMVPLVRHILGNRAEVTFDERTNTLIIMQ